MNTFYKPEVFAESTIPSPELIKFIKNEFHMCAACKSRTQKRFLTDGGYIWHCKCGVTKRVWCCSKDYSEALNFLLA